MVEKQNGHQDPSEMPPDIEVASGEHSSGNDSGTTPGLKGLFIQPFPGGPGAGPIDRFMKASDKPEEFIPLTNVDDYEISRDERILYTKNVANFGNGKMEDVMRFGYILKRAKGGQTSRDVVTMVTGQRQQQQRDWESRQGRAFNQARSNNPLKGAGDMGGG